METVFYIETNATCFAILGVIAFSLERRKTGHSAERVLDIGLFKGLISSVLVMMVFDTMGWALEGVPGRAARAAIVAADSICFGMYSIPTSFYILYADFQINRSAAHVARLAKPLGAIALAVAAMAAVTPFTGLLFSFGADYRFIRGPAFPLFAALIYGLVAWSIILVLLGRKKASPGIIWTLLAYPLPVTAAATARYFAFGHDLVWPATTVFIVLAAFNIQRRRASIDHLTGVANRRSLDEELERLAEGGHSTRHFGGIMLDLDDFKSINDQLGHEAGDRALEDAAAILRSSVRSVDMVARFGGDEFVVLVQGATEESLSGIIKRVKNRTDMHNSARGRPYKLAFSVGASLFDPAADASASDFIARLDTEMYRDKALHKRNQEDSRGQSFQGSG